MERDNLYSVETVLDYITICNRPYFYGYLSSY